jgi:hypothetical protein
LQQIFVRTRWDAVERVVRAHHAANLGVSGALLEGWEVILRQVLGILRIDVSLTPSFSPVSRCDTYDHGIVAKSVVDDRTRIAVLFEVIAGEVLTSRQNLLDWRVDATLQALQQVLCVLARAEHILTRSLLSASPFKKLSASGPASCDLQILTARVSVAIDVRGEEVQTGAASIIVGACFGGDDCSDLEHEVIVKRRRSQDRLGKGSGVGELAAAEGEVDSWASGNAVEGFGPEVIGV